MPANPELPGAKKDQWLAQLGLLLVLPVLLLLEQVGQVVPRAVAVGLGPGVLEVEEEVEVANSAAAEGLLVVAVADTDLAGNVGVHVAEAVSNPE
jgi:hypothetical protein